MLSKLFTILTGLLEIVKGVTHLITFNKHKKAGKDEQIVEQVREVEQRRKEANASLTPDNLDRVRDKYTRD